MVFFYYFFFIFKKFLNNCKLFCVVNLMFLFEFKVKCSVLFKFIIIVFVYDDLEILIFLWNVFL